MVGASDLHHGINALEMEQYFKVPVINLGDNGGYPLNHKIYNVGKFVQPGDIVIFSLAWGYYFAKEYLLTDNYVKSVLDEDESNSFYYENLPIYEKVKFVFFDLPYAMSIEKIFSRPKVENLLAIQFMSIKAFGNRIVMDKGIVRGGSIRNGPEPEAELMKFLSCDQYLFARHILQEINEGQKGDAAEELRAKIRSHDIKYLSLVIKRESSKGNIVDLVHAKPNSGFISTLRLIKSLKDAGVKIFFAWPIVVDKVGINESKCYHSKFSFGIDKLANKIENLLIEEGYDILGDYRDGSYSAECFLNSYGHLKYDCQKKATKSLITYLLQKGIRPSENGYTRRDFDIKLIANLQKRRKSLIDDIIPDSKDVLPKHGVRKRQLDKFILFVHGWSGQEDWGVWSEGRNSNFKFYAKNGVKKRLLIEGIYFNGEEQTEVYLNGRNLGKFVLTKRQLDIPMEEQGAEIFHVELKHEKPISPMELDSKNNDDRKIKFGLTGIRVIYDD